MKRHKRASPDKPPAVTSFKYTVRYILSDYESGEVVFIGNSRDCCRFLNATRSRFTHRVDRYGSWEDGSKKYKINKIQFTEKVYLKGKERKEAIRNAKYAQQYRNRKKSARLGFNGRTDSGKVER